MGSMAVWQYRAWQYDDCPILRKPKWVKSQHINSDSESEQKAESDVVHIKRAAMCDVRYGIWTEAEPSKMGTLCRLRLRPRLQLRLRRVQKVGGVEKGLTFRV